MQLQHFSGLISSTYLYMQVISMVTSYRKPGCGSVHREKITHVDEEGDYLKHIKLESANFRYSDFVCLEQSLIEFVRVHNLQKELVFYEPVLKKEGEIPMQRHS